MKSPKEVYKTIDSLIEDCAEHLDIFAKEEVGQILYIALGSIERDGRKGFAPRDLWNTSNEELIKLLEGVKEKILSGETVPRASRR